MQCRPAGQSHLAILAALVPDPAGLGLAALVDVDADGAALVPDLAGLGPAALADRDARRRPRACGTALNGELAPLGTGPFPGLETSASASVPVR